MKHLSTRFEALPLISFTKDDVEVLMWCCEHHYDHVCKSAGLPGGFVWGIKNRVECSQSGEASVEMRSRQLDTLGKLLEILGRRQIANCSRDAGFLARAASLLTTTSHIWARHLRLTPKSIDEEQPSGGADATPAAANEKHSEKGKA